jgi:uncharacterized protein (DUF58 family)
MLTSRGWWLLLVTLFVTGMGTALANVRGVGLALLGLVVLSFLVIEWCRFLFPLRMGLPRIQIERELHDDRGPIVTLWAKRTFTVTVRITAPGRMSMPLVLADDRFPFGLELVAGGTNTAGVLRHGQPIEITYRIRVRAAGPVRFEGVRLRWTDPQGYFYHETFVRQPLVYPALPPLVDVELNQRTNKRYNILPPPGIHRLHRAGSGSELLDLRDYRPGDPPKLIAWKPSARKDKLITKEFENEVPVRCTLVLDGSQSVRIGPPGHNALARLVEIGSSVAQAALGNRDHVGLIIFDEHNATHVAPARGRRHLIDMLHRLAEVGRLPAAASTPDIDMLTRIAMALMREIYPDLLDRNLNSFPWWLPVLFPRPEYLRTITLTDAVIPWWRRLSATEWRRQMNRKKLSAVLTVVQGYSPGVMAQLMEDDTFFGLALQDFLAQHNVPYPVALYDWRGKYQFAEPQKIDVLSASLLRAVRRAHDNELFVLMVDLVEQMDAIEPLRRALRVALGRHHRVVLVSPWQPDVPLPGTSQKIERPRWSGDVAGQLRQALITRYHNAHEQIRREFGRIGVTVVRALQDDSMQLILDRMEQLRMAGIRR